MKLVICEKPSVAMSISKVIGANKRCDGYFDGNGYKVSWCVGHLIAMANPESYNEKYKYWNLKDLPILPKEFIYEVNKSTKKQYGILNKLMRDKSITSIINACDAGREGELIFRLVYDMVGAKKKVERLWISSLEDSAIKNGFEILKSGELYNNLYNSAIARQQADWLVGMNGSRLYSKLYDNNYSVGRVQTPTLAMIVDRDNRIKNFIKEKYYTLDLVLDEFSLVSDKIIDLEIAKNLKNNIAEDITITDVESKEKITKPDNLYDLTTLQREANKYFSFSAKQTLDYAQSLYEKKLITYPRTDSRFLSEDMKDSTIKLINSFDGDIDVDDTNLNSIFNSKKVTDHHAIIPTSLSISNEVSLPESEAKLFELIKLKLLMAVSKNLVENTVKITCKAFDTLFSANGKSVMQIGFKERLNAFKMQVLNIKDKEEKPLPIVNALDKFKIKEKLIVEKYTQPAKQFTEDTLLKAMEIAGNEALEKDIEVERKGLGTPATRAGIIENLIFKKLIKRDKKNLIPTEQGIKLISLVSDELKSPKMTAEWENKLALISSGEITKECFMSEIEDFIKRLVDTKIENFN